MGPNHKHALSPWLIPILSFATLIAVGTAMLMILPLREAHNSHLHMSFIDALFMATSAACVTGLSVMNIGKELTLSGQIVILVLIQLGGLGIMTFSTGLLLLLGRSISFRSRFILQDTFTYSPRSDFLSLLRRIIFFTLTIEAAGALLLFTRFKKVSPSWGTALYQAIFHSVSAFCNAGFSLFSESITGFRSDTIVVFTMCTLIITGGLGFLVLHELYSSTKMHRNLRRLWNGLSLHTRAVIFTTSILLLTGTLLFVLSEWNVTMKSFSLYERFLAAIFQSTTTRTAGFNTLDFSSMNNITLFGTMILMFIGASPGSTGGGIKTTTFTTLVALGWCRLRGLEAPSLFKRTIDEESIGKAMAVFVLATIVIVSGTALLLVAELGYKPYSETQGLFIKYLFEAISAFGTVGLSMGVTPTLSTWGKLVVTMLMFVGRLGPLTMAMAIRPSPTRAQYKYAEEKIMVG
ncbi:MAG TPA: hypothetical protein ENG14_02830 [Thermodesulforhabdus norvegica]|uniref:Trk system potassium uptake protein TrkH n=1 Tax=Thermodesulforhabdus norvegica TaxID=39841 RepID=A0A7C1B182_9BACT|nr:hypothetical protein [Thermodesulforhabdus norvegica]